MQIQKIQMEMQKIQVPEQMFDRSPASIDIICGQKSRDPCNARPKHNTASHIKDSRNKQNRRKYKYKYKKYKCKYEIDSMMGDHELRESEANQ